MAVSLGDVRAECRTIREVDVGCGAQYALPRDTAATQ